MKLRKILLASGALLVVLTISGLFFLRSLGMFASEPVYQTERGAIGGYDPVAYHVHQEPREGAAQITHEWNGATWHFVSEEHRALFAANPKKYAPQFGGYCAYAVSEHYTARSDPQA